MCVPTRQPPARRDGVALFATWQGAPRSAGRLRLLRPPRSAPCPARTTAPPSEPHARRRSAERTSAGPPTPSRPNGPRPSSRPAARRYARARHQDCVGATVLRPAAAERGMLMDGSCLNHSGSGTSRIISPAMTGEVSGGTLHAESCLMASERVFDRVQPRRLHSP
jgi:hypothetical protein